LDSLDFLGPGLFGLFGFFEFLRIWIFGYFWTWTSWFFFGFGLLVIPGFGLFGFSIGYPCDLIQMYFPGGPCTRADTPFNRITVFIL
jgi:hypothetical protein